MDSEGQIQKVKFRARAPRRQDSHFLKETHLNTKERALENTAQEKKHPFLGQLWPSPVLPVIRDASSPQTGQQHTQKLESWIQVPMLPCDLRQLTSPLWAAFPPLQS